MGFLLRSTLPFFILLVCFFGSNSFLPAQSLTKGQLLGKIAFTEKLLVKTRERQEKSIMDLDLVDTQLKLRLQLLRSITEDIAENDRQIEALSFRVFELENELTTIRDQYGETLQHAYKNFHPENFWLSLLSASSLSEAYYRGVYFRKFNEYKAQQITSIQSRKEELKVKELVQKEKREENQKLLVQKKEEIEMLEQTQVEHEKLLRMLKRKERTYVRKLSADRSRLRELIKEIDEKYGKVPEYNDTQDIGKSFEKEKGFHYWPIPSNRGVIVGEFGTTNDAFGNRVENDGVFVRTSQGQYIRSIFQGRVTGVTPIQMNGYVVIIEHGSYRSVYANLDNVAVKTGDIVGSKQVLGTVRTEPRTHESLLHFLIYKIPDKFLDPTEWIFVD